MYIFSSPLKMFCYPPQFLQVIPRDGAEKLVSLSLLLLFFVVYNLVCLFVCLCQGFDKVGYLRKKDPHNVGGWKKRWFTLKGKSLVYYRRVSITIPTSNYSQTVRHFWFVVSFTHVHTTKTVQTLVGRGDNEGNC